MIRIEPSRALVAAAALALAVAAPAASAQRWYTVEIIAFENLDFDPARGERWPPDPGEPPLDRAVDLIDPAELAAGAGADEPSDGTPHAFRLLPSRELVLHESYRRLRRSREFRPFVHVGWRQPGYGRGQAPRARLRSWPQPAEPAAAAGAVPGTAPVASLAVPVEPGVEGTLRLYVSRYLHLELDLLYRVPPAVAPAGDGAPPSAFRLVTSRRMRSGELHYIDHPAFGLLVLVTPYALPSQAPGQGDAPAPEGEPPAEGEPPREDEPAPAATQS